MTVSRERAEMLDMMPSNWTFAFWKDRYETAQDIASALGILSAAASLKGPADDLIVYLMGIADTESVCDERSRAIAGKGLQVLYRVLERNRGHHSDDMNYTGLDVVEKALWLSRPKSDFKSLVNRFADTSEEEKYVRRYLRSICHTIWEGNMRCAEHAHKVQVVDILYASGRLIDYIPGPNSYLGAPGVWRRFEEMMQRIEELALLDLKPGHTETIEEAAFFGYPAAYIVILGRTLFPAGRAFYERHELKRLRHRA